MNKKVVVGMSGGVDSSVAAYLLKEAGYEVIGVTMQIWQDDNDTPPEQQDYVGCCGLSAVDDARRVADVLDIPYYVLNFKDYFKTKVIDYFVQEYLEARTPNPCIACNRYVKWESLLHKSLQLGADYIATGHYARIQSHPVTGRLALKTSVTSQKDQTYALYNLTQYQLERTLMPVGDYTKDEIRKIAGEMGLPVANKPDSQEICFIPDNDYGKFIETATGTTGTPGDFVDVNGQVLGQHKGIFNYTIGQRRGLTIAMGKPMYVKKIDLKKNQVVLGDNTDIFETEFLISDVNYMSIADLDKPLSLMGKIRYSHKAAPCTIKKEGDNLIRCTFQEPQRAVTPGQAAVFYDDDFILCGGTICGN